MKHSRVVTCGAVLLSPLAALAGEVADWTAEIRKDHPRLFINADTWPDVRRRVVGSDLATTVQPSAGILAADKPKATP
jgi:hypothetical protein